MVNSVVYSKQNNADIRRVVYVPKYDAEVEYLESTGTQYINTNIKYDSDVNIECKFAYTTNRNNNIVFRFAGVNKCFGVIFEQNFGISVQRIDKSRNCSIAFDTEFHTVKNFQTFLQIDDVRQNISSTFDEPSTASIQLFCQYPARFFGFLKLAYFKIYKGATLVRDFIPVRVGSVGYMYDKVSGQLFGNAGTGNFVLGQDVAKPIVKRYVVPLNMFKEVHVQFTQFPFRTDVDEVIYTRDINRRINSVQTPKNITYTGQNYQVWAWVEDNERGYLTCFIGCEYFYPEYGSKLVVHSDTGNSATGMFRYMKITNLNFCKCWDVTYVLSIAYAFKDTLITDFSGLRDWKLENCNNINEAFAQLGNRNIEPFMKCYIGNKVLNPVSVFYGNHIRFDTRPLTEAFCQNWHIKLTTPNWNSSAGGFLQMPIGFLDMTNWDLTEWNSTHHIFFISNYYGTRVKKLKTPLLPLTIVPMPLPYTMYDIDGNAYTEIPINLDKQLVLWANQSDIGK